MGWKEKRDGERGEGKREGGGGTVGGGVMGKKEREGGSGRMEERWRRECGRSKGVKERVRKREL